jgi:hypothetical protein
MCQGKSVFIKNRLLICQKIDKTGIGWAGGQSPDFIMPIIK